jgi:hypothetical protein
MTKSDFILLVQTQGVFTAAFYANLKGISLTVVQLWVKSVKA